MLFSAWQTKKKKFSSLVALVCPSARKVIVIHKLTKAGLKGCSWAAVVVVVVGEVVYISVAHPESRSKKKNLFWIL